MTDLCRKHGLDVDSAISQLLDYKNNPAKQVRELAFLCAAEGLISVIYIN